MPINPWWQTKLELIAGLSSYDELVTDPVKAELFAEYSAPAEPYQLPELDIEDTTVPGPSGPVGIRIYRPRGVPGPVPGLLWAHGGGFRGGTLDMNEGHVVSAEIAARASAVVVSVDYRLAVDGVHYPVPLDDVSAAWTWFTATAGDLGVDPARLSLGGASAGSNLATAAAVRGRDHGAHAPHALLLAYPVVHYPVPALAEPVAREMAQLPSLLRFHASTNEDMFGNYAGRITDIPAEATPGQGDLRGLPPTYVVISEYDDLRSSGELLVRQLQASDVSVRALLAEGMLHGHLNRTPAAVLPGVAASLDFFAAAL
jgi:acetyl esterase